MTKQAIPAVHTGQPVHDQAHAAMKAALETMSGQARNVERLAPLPLDATTEQIIQRINAITERMQ